MNITAAITEYRRHAAASRRIETRRLAQGPFRADGSFRFVGDRTAAALDAHRSALRQIQRDLTLAGYGRLLRALVEIADALELLPYAQRDPKAAAEVRALRAKLRTERGVIRKLVPLYA